MVSSPQVVARPHVSLVAMAWLVMLAVSVLPNALLHELAGASSTDWLKWAKLGLLAIMIAISFAWHELRSLRHFFVLLLAIFVTEEIASRLGATASWQAWFGGEAPFVTSMLGSQVLRVLVAFAMIGVLLSLGYRRTDFFLVPGRLAAPIAPVRWLGYARPIPWTRFGAQWTVFITLGLLVFLVLGGRPTASALWQTLPLLPMVGVLAAMNAFSEEMTYRATLLAGLEPAVGARQALWIAALFFGLGHYFGVPYGLVGVALAAFLGWMLGKAMLETRGFFWAWFIHFVQDVLIFAFMAAGSITPGG
jgi:membrane protease YdiL (CAAX protease family)